MFVQIGINKVTVDHYLNNDITDITIYWLISVIRISNITNCEWKLMAILCRLP